MIQIMHFCLLDIGAKLMLAVARREADTEIDGDDLAASVALDALSGLQGDDTAYSGGAEADFKGGSETECMG